MQYRRLGDSDLEVSEICLGSWLTFGDKVGREQTEACTEAAFDAGINFFDTANVYGKGAAEELYGEILNRRPRDSFILATKLYFPVRFRKKPWTWRDYGLSAKQIRKQIDRSLKRLRTDYVDLYQCHRYDPETPLEETMEALTEVVKQGKARYIGFSEWPIEAIREALAMPGVAKFVSSQPQYSLLHRDPEAELIPLCRENGISQIVFSPLAQGVLTGKYKPNEAPPVGSRGAIEELGHLLHPEVLEAVQRLVPIAEGAGLTMPQLALAWILREPNVAAAIVGATHPGHVTGGAAASGVKLSDDTLRAIDDALRPVAAS
jgi:aryl-alcohol dehydrogenase-like predicted oxidoreductase